MHRFKIALRRKYLDAGKSGIDSDKRCFYRSGRS